MVHFLKNIRLFVLLIAKFHRHPFRSNIVGKQQKIKIELGGLEIVGWNLGQGITFLAPG